MAYCTIAQLTDLYGETLLLRLSDRSDEAPEVPSIDADLFERTIADADALIDGYLKPIYALPIAGGVPALLIDLSQRIAIYKSHGQVVSEKIRDDYRDALKTLALISDGTIRLDLAGVEPEGSGAGGVRATETHRPLTIETMKGYV